MPCHPSSGSGCAWALHLETNTSRSVDSDVLQGCACASVTSPGTVRGGCVTVAICRMNASVTLAVTLGRARPVIFAASLPLWRPHQGLQAHESCEPPFSPPQGYRACVGRDFPAIERR